MEHVAGIIYLASPYTHQDKDVERARFEMACRAAAALMGKGQYVFSPIAHSHPVALAAALPTDWAYWAQYDQLMIQACAEVWVLMLEGWQSSRGVHQEVRLAKAMGKPVRYMAWAE